jgi:cyclopropane fatty-acyl-phospholipid synthase-like methyltransferase
MLAQHGWTVMGVDFVPKAVRKGKQKVRKAGVEAELRVGDVTQPLYLGLPFDLILDIGCYHSLPEDGRPNYVENVKRLLAPGGTYLLYAFTKTEGTEGAGVTEAEIEALSPPLELVSRQDGTERGRRPSAWFAFTRPEGEDMS